MTESVSGDRVHEVVANWFPRFLANDLDYLDVRRTLDGIGSWADWADAWTATADGYEELAERAAEQGHGLTAGEHLRRAALTLHFAQFVLNDEPDKRVLIHRRQCDLYARAAPMLRPPAVRVDIPTSVGGVPGYLRQPLAAPASGLVVLVPGLESTKEQFSSFEPYFLDRGVATLSIEGPGQGEMRLRRVFRDEDYRLAAAGVSAFAREHLPSLRRLAVLGTSFGGYLALRHADAFADLAAVVDIAGPFDLAWFSQMQPVVREGFMHLLGVDTPAEAESLLASMSLRGQIRRDVPVLVVHGARDPIIPVEHAHRIAVEIRSGGTPGGNSDGTPSRSSGLVSDGTPGGAPGVTPGVTLHVEPDGNHSCNNRYTVVRPLVADWVCDRIREASQR